MAETATTSDLPNGELCKKLVQEISKRGGDVPERYIYKDGFPEAIDAPDELWRDTLLIDFSLLSSFDEYELAKLKSALSNWGCFQVINHGMDMRLLEELIEVGKQFFALPLKEKLKWSTKDEQLMQGYGSDSGLAGEQILCWHDRLFLTLYPEESRMPQFWPHEPYKFRETLEEYAKRLPVMIETVYKAMARSLDLEDENSFLNQIGRKNGSLTARFIMYPRCPCPERVLGVKPHSDSADMAVLLAEPEVEGLQIHKDGQWFKVPVIPGALFVNLGELTEIMSNGAFKAAVHRVVTNSAKDRVSIAAFNSHGSHNEIRPISELVRSDEPQMYKKFNNKDEYWQEYCQKLRAMS